MADGDVVLDLAFAVEEPPGTRVTLFACEDSDRPGGYTYSFQHYDPTTGETLLRYDDAHEHPSAGWHHRHAGEGEPEAIPFEGLLQHVERFREEVAGNDE